VQPNLAAGGFLELLQRLRSVFLQVSTYPTTFFNLVSLLLMFLYLGFCALAY
jgi:hypothetical protein